MQDTTYMVFLPYSIIAAIVVAIILWKATKNYDFLDLFETKTRLKVFGVLSAAAVACLMVADLSLYHKSVAHYVLLVVGAIALLIGYYFLTVRYVITSALLNLLISGGIIVLMVKAEALGLGDEVYYLGYPAMILFGAFFFLQFARICAPGFEPAEEEGYVPSSVTTIEPLTTSTTVGEMVDMDIANRIAQNLNTPGYSAD